MSQKFSLLNSFSHITNHVNHPVHALVSVQYPALSGLQSLSDSINGIFKRKRAVYLALSDNKLFHVHTVGDSVSSKDEIHLDHLEDIRFNATRMPDHKDFHVPTVTLTVRKQNKKKVEEIQHEFMLFPSLFLPNLTYSEKQQHLFEALEMRTKLIDQLSVWKQKIEDRKVLEALNKQA